jgi:hypothetical protein
MSPVKKYDAILTTIFRYGVIHDDVEKYEVSFDVKEIKVNSYSKDYEVSYEQD